MSVRLDASDRQPRQVEHATPFEESADLPEGGVVAGQPVWAVPEPEVRAEAVPQGFAAADHFPIRAGGREALGGIAIPRARQRIVSRAQITPAGDLVAGERRLAECGEGGP